MVLIPLSLSSSVLLLRLQLSQDRFSNTRLGFQKAPRLIYQVGKVFPIACKPVQVDHVLIKKHAGDLTSEFANKRLHSRVDRIANQLLALVKIGGRY